MHSTIYQITREKVIDETCLLNEDTLPQGDYEEIDYCSSLTEEERKKRIGMLVNNLPSGMFTLVDEDTLQYNGGIELYYTEWAEKIKAKASAISLENIATHYSPLYPLQKEIENPLDIGSLFYTDNEGCEKETHKSGEFMTSINRLKKGERLYIGGVLDYHH